MKIGRENELLICVARSQMDEQTKTRLLMLLKDKPDWSGLLTKAERHRLMPLLYWHLKDVSQQIPEPFCETLKCAFNENAKNNLLLTAETIRLVRLFEENGIIAVPYKGSALAERLYGNMALRSCVDLDLLICRKDLKRARRVLLSTDYKQEIEISDEQLDLYALSECDQVFIHRKTQIYLELHWAITPPYFGFNLEIEDLFSRLDAMELSRNLIPTFCPQDLLLILCVNATKEMWERLEWIGCVAELIRKDRDLNWNDIIKRAKDLNSSRMLLLGVHLASEIFKIDLPQNVLSLIKKDRAIKTLVQTVYERLFHDKEDLLSKVKVRSTGFSLPTVGRLKPVLLTMYNQTLFRLKTREKLLTRLLYCLLRLTTPTHPDLNYIKLPLSLSWLYYFVRPLRLLTQAVSTQFQQKLSQRRADMPQEAAE